MRGDVEGDIGRRPPPDNIDISAFLTLEHGTGRNAEFATRLLLGWLSNYKSVKTDRLHVCIACGLLGLDVEFFPNNYFKCAAVWEHSLRDRFPNIRWAGIVHTSVGKN
jgi:exopolysaccharide biosynthesis predicted pyruvyltransferase EpsI